MIEDPQQPSIAVLIPVLNEAERIGPLLVALKAMDFSEIIVADGSSTDGTEEIVRSSPGVILVLGARGRGAQINAAAKKATAAILLVLHADSVLPDNAPGLIRQTLSRGDVKAGCFRLAFDRSSRVLKLYSWFSRFETRFTTFGDQAFFMQRTTFDAVGGAPEWPFLEDVALRQRLLSHGHFVKRPEQVVTSARRFVNRGPVMQQLINAIVLLGYHSGVPAHKLARFYGAQNTS